MSTTIKCKRCGKTIAASKRAAFPLATEFTDGTWKHKAPCDPSTTPIWAKGQRVTIECYMSGLTGNVMAPEQARVIAKIAKSTITLDNGTVWQIDGKTTPSYPGLRPARVRPEERGDGEQIERRAMIGKIVSTRDDVWSKIGINDLRSVVASIGAVENVIGQP